MNKIIKNNTATLGLETGNFEDLPGNFEDLPGKDMVNEPQHYKLDGLDIETKDVIKSVLGEDGYKNFCHGNILKYVMRANKKNIDNAGSKGWGEK